jgi:hypothetical protein
VDTSRDAAHCGGCNLACGAGAECQGGGCVCPSATTDCGGLCVDTTSDPANCGSCGRACAPGERCVAGACDACGGTARLSADVQPIFDARCTGSCHGGRSPSAGLSLEPGVSRANLVGVASRCRGRLLVAPGDASASHLYDRVTDTGPCGGGRMPPSGPALSNAQLEAVRIWICRGALDD